MSQEALHPRTEALVSAFADALREKLFRAERKYGYSDNWATDDWADECRQQLLAHVAKGDPLDVAAYAAFCWARGWLTTAASEPTAPEGPHDTCWLGCPLCSSGSV